MGTRRQGGHTHGATATARTTRKSGSLPCWKFRQLNPPQPPSGRPSWPTPKNASEPMENAKPDFKLRHYRLSRSFDISRPCCHTPDLLELSSHRFERLSPTVPTSAPAPLALS